MWHTPRLTRVHLKKINKILKKIRKKIKKFKKTTK